MNKLAGISLAKDCIKFDYCIKESILSLLGICDFVICAYVDSDDGTLELLESISAPNLKILHFTQADWDFYNDKNRLSYLTNCAIAEADRMGFQYILSVQADEVLHESSYPQIRRAISENHDGYMVRRINLWKTPEFELNVEHHRKPCSTEIIRLTKSNYRAYDDAESIAAPVNAYLDDVVIVHYGFVRKKEIMKDKIKNMQQQVFGMQDADAKLDLCEVFNPDLWFDPIADLISISVTHPKVMTEWVKDRP